MIATSISMWLPPVLLVCCALIAGFGLLLPRRPLIGAFGIATMVMCIVGAALLGGRPGRFAAVWPRVVAPDALSSPQPQASVEIRHTKSPPKSLFRQVVHGAWCKAVGIGPRCMASGLLTAAAIAAFLGVGYVFLDASTRGQFTWPLRVVAVVAFAAIYTAMVSLR